MLWLKLLHLSWVFTSSSEVIPAQKVGLAYRNPLYS